MTRNEARLLALGYAWGTGEYVKSPDMRAGDCLFADAFATIYDDYEHNRRGSKPSLEDAWETWQASGGRTVDRYAEPYCNHDAVAVINGVCECGTVVP